LFRALLCIKYGRVLLNPKEVLMAELWARLEGKAIPRPVETERKEQDGDSHEPSDGESLGPTPVDEEAKNYVPVPSRRRAKPLEHVDMLPSDYEEEEENEEEEEEKVVLKRSRK
jgi:hypothetical protein